MILEDFIAALQDVGVDSYKSGMSLRVKECPECGRKKFNVIFKIADSENKYFLGKCLSGSCNKGFSSASYLRKSGMDDAKIREYHGFSEVANLEKALGARPEMDFIGKEEEVIKADVDISSFHNLEYWPNHPVTTYARSRGYVSELSSNIMADIDSSAVVFVCHDLDGSVLGYQKRFVKVIGDGPKTKTAFGFLAHENILIFNKVRSNGIVICEGPFTALSAWHYGYTGVCTFGADISNTQLEKIEKLAGDMRIYSATERDEAGDKFYRKISNYFHWKKRTIDHMYPMFGSDLNDSYMAKKGFSIQEGEEPKPMYPRFKF